VASCCFRTKAHAEAIQQKGLTNYASSVEAVVRAEFFYTLDDGRREDRLEAHAARSNLIEELAENGLDLEALEEPLTPRSIRCKGS
jgi:hypothetical protein